MPPPFYFFISVFCQEIYANFRPSSSFWLGFSFLQFQFFASEHPYFKLCIQLASMALYKPYDYDRNDYNPLTDSNAVRGFYSGGFSPPLSKAEGKLSRYEAQHRGIKTIKEYPNNPNAVPDIFNPGMTRRHHIGDGVNRKHVGTRQDQLGNVAEPLFEESLTFPIDRKKLIPNPPAHVSNIDNNGPLPDAKVEASAAGNTSHKRYVPPPEGDIAQKADAKNLWYLPLAGGQPVKLEKRKETSPPKIPRENPNRTKQVPPPDVHDAHVTRLRLLEEPSGPTVHEERYQERKRRIQSPRTSRAAEEDRMRRLFEAQDNLIPRGLPLSLSLFLSLFVCVCVCVCYHYHSYSIQVLIS